ncbi:expressed protein [Dictyostelium purpureum]|uniref:Expressed protein n=1 Tax=Dictyostelium purpureum TaxID=5786 RepID=F0Z6D9_DICPU|nr:uncharacterized protein DICPUDRAFT_91016 [Dictyostelium purpureum]EGC40427.1 expressed protein [Dictyostelium purpureum]|eukprot:XP_003282974.1 expressed protein [Dictyostelium purpureum]
MNFLKSSVALLALVAVAKADFNTFTFANADASSTTCAADGAVTVVNELEKCTVVCGNANVQIASTDTAGTFDVTYFTEAACADTPAPAAESLVCVEGTAVTVGDYSITCSTVTEAPTETPTETPTEKPTETPTEKPTENPTETPSTTESSSSSTLLVSVTMVAASVVAALL